MSWYLQLDVVVPILHVESAGPYSCRSSSSRKVSILLDLLKEQPWHSEVFRLVLGHTGAL